MSDDDQQYKEWLASRPPLIQYMALTYPCGWYRVKPGAPYGISAPGTRVELIGYSETGEVIIAVWAKDLIPAGLEHIHKQCKKYNRDYDVMSKMDHRTHVDPSWLTPDPDPPVVEAEIIPSP